MLHADSLLAGLTGVAVPGADGLASEVVAVACYRFLLLPVLLVVEAWIAFQP